MHCLVCAAPIPEERWLQKRVTCSEDCQSELDIAKRRRRDKKKCRLCSRRIPLSERIAAECEMALESVVSLGCGCQSNQEEDWHSTRCAVPIAKDALRELRGFRERRQATRRKADRCEHSGAVSPVHTAEETVSQ